MAKAKKKRVVNGGKAKKSGRAKSNTRHHHGHKR
tara:strand:- start:1 stop:102 length:102 start_codon:yes stop_codon:yes gene_type:complete